MSIPLDVAWRGCAANYPQPMRPEAVQDAEYWLAILHSVNCVEPREEERIAEIVYRSGYQQEDILRHVFRWDDAPYTEVFLNGFQARRETDIGDDAYCNLYNYVHHAGRPLDSRRPTPYVFISTTVSSGWHPSVTSGTERVVYRYEIYAPGGIWVAPTLGDRYRHRGQDEVSFVGGIAPQYIRSAQAFTLRCATGDRHTTRNRVNHTIFRNRHFDPEHGTQLRIQRPIIYYRENNQSLPLEIVDYPPQPQGRMKREVYTDTTSWYARDVANITSYISAAFRSSRENEAYLFMKDQYVLLNYAPGTTNDMVVNGPLLICEGYPSLTDTAFAEHGIDCAFGSHHGDEAFIFSENLCAHINYAPGTTEDKIIKGPIAINAMFDFFKGTEFEKGVDAAFESTTKYEAYLFKGNRYALIDYSSDNPHLIAIREINEGFPSLKGTIFESGIEAAFASHRFNEAYLFKGDSYALINFAPATTDDYIVGGGVKKIIPNWPSLASILPVKNGGLDLHDHHPEPEHAHDEL